MGRTTGGRNRGYFFRTGRGWYARRDGRYVPLLDDDGNHLKDKSTPKATVKAAYQRLISEPEQPAESDANSPDDGVTILEVCTAYLAKAETDNSPSTYASRAGTLFDFCYGLPSKFRGSDATPKDSDYIHDGYGKLPVSRLLKLHLDRWLAKHKKWKGGKRTKIQAVLRALNYGVECGLITANPVKGYKNSRPVARVTYITPEQEAALCKAAGRETSVAIKVLIRTGARPGCEFAALTSRHVKDHGERMEWIFQPTESKTRRLRTLRITDPDIIAIVRERLAKTPKGEPIFRAPHGEPWLRRNLTRKFRYYKEKLVAKGMAFDKDCVLYSCRHTYAKRTLQGYWTGKQTNIETLARLMGNSVEVCRDHYLQWTETYNEPLWDSA